MQIKLCSRYSANIPSVFPFERDPTDAKYIDLAFAEKADFLVTRDRDILDLRYTEPLTQSFERLGWQFKIVDPFEVLSNLRDRDQT